MSQSSLTTVADLLSHHENLTKAAKSLMEKKNHDYGGREENCWGNLELVEALTGGDVTLEEGVLIRMGDKLSRLWTISHSEAMVVDESVDDTIIDIINYAVLLSARIKERRGYVGETV